MATAKKGKPAKAKAAKKVNRGEKGVRQKSLHESETELERSVVHQLPHGLRQQR